MLKYICLFFIGLFTLGYSCRPIVGNVLSDTIPTWCQVDSLVSDFYWTKLPDYCERNQITKFTGLVIVTVYPYGNYEIEGSKYKGFPIATITHYRRATSTDEDCGLHCYFFFVYRDENGQWHALDGLILYKTVLKGRGRI